MFDISKRPLRLAAFGRIWPSLISFQTVANSKQEVTKKSNSTFGRTCWLLYKRNPFVQTRSTNFFVLLGIFWHFFFTCSHPFCPFFYLLRIHFAFSFLFFFLLFYIFMVATYPFCLYVQISLIKKSKYILYTCSTVVIYIIYKILAQTMAKPSFGPVLFLRTFPFPTCPLKY